MSPARRRGSLRSLIAISGLAAAVLAVAVLTLVVGRLGIPLAELPQRFLELLGGQGGFALRELRGPRLAVAIGAGAALGIAGALFQRATANPLATPDVLGITTAAGAGTALARVSDMPGGFGAVLGAATAAAVIILATGRGERTPARVIVAGIGVAAASAALIQLVLAWTRQSEALAIASALTGSLSARGWDEAGLVWGALLPCGAAALALRRDLGLLALGDDAAHGLGSRPVRFRALALALGVALTAAAVAAAGPIAFVALMAPHFAAWVTGRPVMGTAGVTGALLVAGSDLAVAQLEPLAGLPVGIVTSLVGGGFLALLLVSQFRKGTL